mgnify:CR=1 FL=1
MLNAENIALIENITKKIIYFIIFGIITIYIFLELISITNFTYNYVKLEKYGEKLKKRCKNDNIEFETSRYQIYNNILNYLQNNDKDSKSNYIIVLIIFLIFSITFSVITTYILYKVIDEIKNINLDNSNEFKFICNILILLACVTSISYIPIYVGVYFDINNNWNINDFENIMKKILYGFAILCAIILIIRLNVYNNFREYSYGNIFIITLIGFYMGIIYYTKKIINYYKNNIIKIDYKYENIKNIEDKKELILKKYNRDDIFDEKKNIISEYIIEIFGLKYYRKKIEENDLNNINIYIYIIQIILIILLVLFFINRLKGLNKLYKDKNFTFKNLLDCILYKIKDCDNLLYKNHEVQILYNLIFLPLCIVLVIYIIINSTINFNNNLNENIIIKPLIIYKKELEEINNNFKNLINNDKLDYTYLKSIERNTANAILLVLYNEIFSDFLSLDSDTNTINGLKWQRANDIKNGIELINEELSNSLSIKREFTKSEWNKFNINNLNSNHYIKVGGSYYKPVKNITNNTSFINELNIIPEFHFTFGNVEESIIDYINIKEYDIKYYLNNKYNKNDIFKLNEYCKNVNKQCNTINTYLLYYIIRKIFLYNPIANELKNNKVSDVNYYYYKNILKYKILKAIENIKNNKNYLGNSKLDINNNHKINNTISIKNNDPKFNLDEINKLYAINPDDKSNIILLKNEFIKEINEKNIDLNNIDELLNILNDSKYELLMNNSILSRIIEKRIDNLLNNNITISNELIKKIDKIINYYIEFIIKTQKSYYLNLCENEECNIDDNELIEIYKSDITNNNKNSQNMFRFINIFKNDITILFDNINNELKEFNKKVNGKDDIKYVNENKNKISKFIIDNYNSLNKDDNYLNKEIVLINKLNCPIEKNIKNAKNIVINEENIEYYNKLDILINDILLSFYLNNNLILKVYNSYNELHLDALIKNIERIYKSNEDKKNMNDIKMEYIAMLNKLKLILDKTINNDQLTELIIYDDDNLLNLSLNEEIIEKMIEFNNKNNEDKYYLNTLISEIKTFKKNVVINTDNITKDNIKNVMGINNKIEVYIKYMEKNKSKINTKLNDKTKEFINNMLILQKAIFNEVKNSDLLKFNYNKLLKKLNYENKFNEYISEYRKHYSYIYNNNEEEEVNIVERSFNINMNNSKISKRDAEKTSLTSTILLLIYILSYIWIASIK